MYQSLHTANHNASPKLAVGLSYFIAEKRDYSLMANEENTEGKKTTAIVARNIRRLLQHRKDNKLPHTQDWLAGQVGMSTPYLSQILKGVRIITVKYINLCAAALGVSPAELMDDGNNDEAHQIAKRVEAVVRASANYADMFKTLLDGAEAKVAEKKP